MQSNKRVFGNKTLSTCKVIPGFQMVRQNFSLVSCPVTPPGLVGPIKVWYDEPTFEEIERLNPYLEPGGHGKPKSCQSRHRVAVIVPYRLAFRIRYKFYQNFYWIFYFLDRRQISVN